MNRMRLSILPAIFSISRLSPTEQIPAWASQGSFFTVTRTDEELSIVCEQELVPTGVKAECDWRCIKLHGPIPFATTGVIAALTRPLADAKISVSAIATYDTDYLLVKADTLAAAVLALKSAGFDIRA
jgi:hypothetical protein